ncbi:asparagine synthase (glutamine-hydrolyzing) [Trinickia caryophylli]|uniref:asparagine synthase (glutamine-hydrolyzing) n=1 Tax=Trinickia caryophylli TaxID=28094 RepID=A0A1X7FQL9_TRICW|nr:asparagine synthase (glutamine-hydrolyzing) [Trinickia caryophylli]PMS09508.1 asparagine synthase (glutamine-hydrolyzing) [Trinickia caryophylli]TRX14454.1 asparagine synthase (glutamine-hydrolyzing) [Trinickia caryophylli]WQE14291.1 asparagine synthase (glutamine-hydrolyzing) [Trinickia caryophylli]SMF56533.1 asparagine synthase (glutamine-hydrolysing) [Trinickia caryophylli]GLU33195.1 asparagine synthetase B [Trinickia caryophylli]
MCGIAGAVCFDGLPSRAHRIVGEMTSAVSRRGPDGEGAYRDRYVALGHRRLAIVDVAGGRQPFCNEDCTVAVVFNGEIYNHRALRTALLKLGHRLSSNCDGEVIAHLYEEHGDAFLKHIAGMFALALYDRRRGRLILARDRTGEKPLYYARMGAVLYFASTTKALLHACRSSLSLCRQGLLGYFAHTQPIAPATIFEQFSKLPAGHFLAIGPGNASEIRPYWLLSYCRKAHMSPGEAREALDCVLREAVSSCLDSDYPLALTLSGGIDSSLVLSYAVDTPEKAPPSCHTLGAHEEDEEFARADAVARQFGLAAQRFCIIGTSYPDMVEALRAFDEPLNVYDGVYLLQHSRYIARTHRVALTGNGADELFGGYDSYLAWGAPPHASDSPAPDPRRSIELMLASAIEGDAAQLYGAAMSRFAREYDVAAHMSCMHAVAEYDTAVDARLCYDLFLGMSHCASLGDTVGMSFGLEYRSPFLHPSVVEFAAALPGYAKLCSLSRATKVVLRAVAQRRIPGISAHAPKLGCGQHIDRYALMRAAWRPDIESALRRHRPLLASYVEPAKAQMLWSSFCDGRTGVEADRRVLKLVMFVAWLDAHSHLF